MGLLTRLVAPLPGEVKIPVHQFMAALAEFKRGAPNVTIVAIGTAFGLSAPELVELDAFVANQLGDVITREMVHDVLMLGEDGIYTVQNCADRLTAAGTSNLLPLIVQRQIQILGRAINDCVLSGCAVTAQGSPNLTVAVAKGAVMTNGILRAVTAGNVTIPAADATKPRFDIVVVDSSGVKQCRQGTANPSPIPPLLSSNDVALCFVYVRPADTDITSGELLDARVISTNGTVTVGKITSPVTFNNTSAAQTYITLVMPSGLFTTGKVLRVNAGGTMLLNNGSPTVTLAISYGGTTMFQDVTATATADADRIAWNLDFQLIAQANNDQALNGMLQLGPINGRTGPAVGVGDIAVPNVLAGVEVSGPFNGAAAVDSDSADRSLIVQFTMSIANAANEITLEYATGELV